MEDDAVGETSAITSCSSLVLLGRTIHAARPRQRRHNISGTLVWGASDPKIAGRDGPPRAPSYADPMKKRGTQAGRGGDGVDSIER